MVPMTFRIQMISNFVRLPNQLPAAPRLAGLKSLFLRWPLNDNLALIGRLQWKVNRLRLFRRQVELPRRFLHVGRANQQLVMAGRELQIQRRLPHELSVDPYLGMIRYGMNSNLRRVWAGMILKKLQVHLRCHFGVPHRKGRKTRCRACARTGCACRESHIAYRRPQFRCSVGGIRRYDSVLHHRLSVHRSGSSNGENE